MRNPPFNNEQRLGFLAVGHNPFKVARWGLALISGRYKQGKNLLENPDTGAMCCVGVLCTITPNVERKGHRDMKGGPYEVVFSLPENSHGDREESSSWIDPVLLLGGDEDVAQDLLDMGEYPDFAAANDIRNVSFRTIGLWLLETVPTLLINQLRGRHG